MNNWGFELNDPFGWLLVNLGFRFRKGRNLGEIGGCVDRSIGRGLLFGRGEGIEEGRGRR